MSFLLIALSIEASKAEMQEKARQFMIPNEFQSSTMPAYQGSVTVSASSKASNAHIPTSEMQEQEAARQFMIPNIMEYQIPTRLTYYPSVTRSASQSGRDSSKSEFTAEQRAVFEGLKDEIKAEELQRLIFQRDRIIQTGGIPELRRDKESGILFFNRADTQEPVSGSVTDRKNESEKLLQGVQESQNWLNYRLRNYEDAEQVRLAQRHFERQHRKAAQLAQADRSKSERQLE